MGEFQGDDQILVLYKNGDYQLYNFDLSNHFDQDMLAIEKYDADKVLSVVYYDAEQDFYYVKRFQIDDAQGKRVSFIGENDGNKLISVTWVHYPRLQITFGGKNAERENEIVEVAEFIGVKSHKARGKRLTNYEVENITEMEPIVRDEDEHESLEEEPEPDADDDVPFEINRKKKDDEEDDKNQMSLF